MKFQANLNLTTMSSKQAYGALKNLEKNYDGKSGRIVFLKNDAGEITGTDRSRGFWSGIKAFFSNSYSKRLADSEKELGQLVAKCLGSPDERGTAWLVDVRNRRHNESKDGIIEHNRNMHAADLDGMMIDPDTAKAPGVTGQVTPGLIGATMKKMKIYKADKKRAKDEEEIKRMITDQINKFETSKKAMLPGNTKELRKWMFGNKDTVFGSQSLSAKGTLNLLKDTWRARTAGTDDITIGTQQHLGTIKEDVGLEPFLEDEVPDN